MIITDTSGASFDKVAMDIVGPLPKTERGNEYILTLQDQLMKFCMGIPLPDQTSETIAEAFIDRFICVLGAPKAILIDQGRNFLRINEKGCKNFQNTQISHHRLSSTIEWIIRKVASRFGRVFETICNSQKQWDRWISLAMFNYNTNVHEATKRTPYELIFGKIARIPSNEPLAPDDKLQ